MVRSVDGRIVVLVSGSGTNMTALATACREGRVPGAIVAVVADHRPDLVVSAGFMRILAPVFVDAFEGRLINLHPALLPAFPGAHAVRDALDHGVKVTGTTVHLIDHDVDHGRILFQVPVEVLPDDTEESLHERIKEAEHQLLPEACRRLLESL